MTTTYRHDVSHAKRVIAASRGLAMARIVCRNYPTATFIAGRWTVTRPDRWAVRKIDLCSQCLVVTANGCETDEDIQTAEALAREWPGWDVHGNCPENCDGWFSWSSCEGCGESLGGTRHPGVAMRRNRKRVTA